MSPSHGSETDMRHWKMLGLLALAELLGMSVWFSASAVSAQYRAMWQLSPAETGWLTTIVSLGFVCGTAIAAILNLADVVPGRLLFSVSACIASLTNAALLADPGYRATLFFRFLTGVSLAGVYPPGMKMVATWFKARRGLAVGSLVGALAVGKGAPYLVHAFPGAGVHQVIATATVFAFSAAVLVAVAYSDGPFPFPPRKFSWGLVGEVIRQRQWRLASGGYFGHMLELYAAWTWLPVFVAASIAAHGDRGTYAESMTNAIAFAALAAGGLGCVWGGFAADRRGREWLVTLAMSGSGLCALTIGFAFGRSLWLLVPVALAWGFLVVADSAQFSVLVTESVPPHAVGTALTLQTSIGFLLTMITIQLTPVVAAAVGWRWAFPMLALGPVLGIASIRRLVVSKRAIG